MTQHTMKSFPMGGIHPQDHKLSADQAITSLPVTETVSVFFSQHIGAPATPLIKPGDQVKTGQLIAESAGFISANIHSPVTGTVVKFEEVMDASGYKKTAAVIKVADDEWEDGIDLTPDLKTDIPADPDLIRQKVQKAGIVGLGGATFPTHVKLGVPSGKAAEVLLVNGVECEPYLTADHRLMLEKGREILVGIRIALAALGLKKAIIGIENNKPDAIKYLQSLLTGEDPISIQALKVRYPQGGERQLVKALTGREIPPPPRGLPIDVGAVVLNVATCKAIYDAVQKNKPLIERVITVTGCSIQKPSNFLARIGVPIQSLIDAAGGLPEQTGKVISGGPMMGKSLASLDCPVTKGTGGIVVFDAEVARRQDMMDCIRCGKCVSVCPLGLEPYLLAALVERNMLDRAEAEKITNCCECACCTYTCPSSRSLLDYIRLGKTAVLKAMRERQQK